MRGLGTKHVISGPMRGLKKTASYSANPHTGVHCNSKTIDPAIKVCTNKQMLVGVSSLVNKQFTLILNRSSGPTQ